MGQSLSIAILVTFGALFLLMALGMRIYATLGFAGIIASYFLLSSLKMLPFVPFAAANSWSLTSIPLYVFMGTIFLHAGISERLYRGAAALFGWLPGGLLHSNIAAAAIFSAITGSSAGTAATIGSVALPALEKRGYDVRLNTASIAAGGTLGALIPPSTVCIVFGSLTNTNIGQLFFGCLIPGLILTVLYMGAIMIWALFQPKIAPAGERAGLREMLLGLKDLSGILVTIVIVLGGIYYGVFTPTEAAAIGCVLALLLAFLFRGLSWRAVHKSALSAIEITCFIMMILVGSSIFANALAGLLVPYKLATLVTGLSVSPLMVLIIVCLFYGVLGCLMEGLSLMIMTVPVIFPIMTKLGFDPIFFGVIVTILIQLGLITPPVGTGLFVVQGVRGKGSLSEVIAGIWPFVIAMVILTIIVIIWPSLALWLPARMIKG